MLFPRGILGINARNLKYIKPSTSRRVMRILDNKLRAKAVLEKAGLPVPKTYAVINSFKELAGFAWNALPASFALKPGRGFGGAGVIIVYARKKQQTASGAAWIRADNSIVTAGDLRDHILAILDGRFSISSLPDLAFFEERIQLLKLFRPYAHKGIPDIRVIVYNSIPVMAELRLPTKESQGRANLHLGAIGLGLAMDNGVTTHAVQYDQLIEHHPDNPRLALRGLKIPHWNNILELAVEAQRVSGSRFVGVDIGTDKERGPVILELNGRPGLSIQIANLAPLEERLKKTAGLKVQTAQQGAAIAQDLFRGRAFRPEGIYGKKIIGAREEVEILGQETPRVWAKIDTGAYRTVIDEETAERLGLTKVKKYKSVRGALGKHTRPIVDLKFKLGEDIIETEAFVAERGEMKHALIIGRRDLKRYIIDPSRNVLTK